LPGNCGENKSTESCENSGCRISYLVVPFQSFSLLFFLPSHLSIKSASRRQWSIMIGGWAGTSSELRIRVAGGERISQRERKVPPPPRPPENGGRYPILASSRRLWLLLQGERHSCGATVVLSLSGSNCSGMRRNNSNSNTNSNSSSNTDNSNIAATAATATAFATSSCSNVIRCTSEGPCVCYNAG